MDDFYKIIPVKTNKDKIKQPDCVKYKILPKFPSTILVIGKSGSGKSILVQNILFDKRFYKDFFDEIYLVSPTAKSDDVQKAFKLDDDNIMTDLETAPQEIENILNFQRETIEEKGIENALKVCMVFDDCVSDQRFMKNEILTKLAISCRHYGVMTIINSQSYTTVPRRIRLQSHMICFFPSSFSEVQLLAEEYSPPHGTKKEFYKMVKQATNDDYNFLTILMTEPAKTRYRRNLANVIRWYD